MQAPPSDDDELEWLIDDEVTYGPDARRGVVVALSAHGHLRRDHQTVRVRWSDGWGAEQEVSATHPTLRRAYRFELQTPATATLTTPLTEDPLALDEQEKKPEKKQSTKTMRRMPEEDEEEELEQKKRRLNIEEAARDEPKRKEEALQL